MPISIITGASSGLGWEFARQIDRKLRPKEIWLIARRKQRLDELAKQLKFSKGIPLQADLTDDRQIAKIKEKLEKEKPHISLLVNNAGFGKFGPFEKVGLEQSLEVINLNINSLVKLTHICLPYMKKNSSILQVSSVAGFIPLPNNSIYSATKAFVLSFSNSLLAELRGKGIHVMAVCPGTTKTEFFERFYGKKVPYKRPLALPKDVVAKALKDMKRKKAISIYGISNKMIASLSRLIPRKTLVRAAYITNRIRAKRLLQKSQSKNKNPNRPKGRGIFKVQDTPLRALRLRGIPNRCKQRGILNK